MLKDPTLVESEVVQFVTLLIGSKLINDVLCPGVTGVTVIEY